MHLQFFSTFIPTFTARGTRETPYEWLYEAIWNPDLETMTQLLPPHGFEHEFRGTQDGPLMLAIQWGWIEAVNVLLPSVASKNEHLNINPCLIEAIHRHALEVVGLSLPLSDPTHQHPDGMSALMTAVTRGDLTWVEQLLPSSNPQAAHHFIF